MYPLIGGNVSHLDRVVHLLTLYQASSCLFVCLFLKKKLKLKFGYFWIKVLCIRFSLLPFFCWVPVENKITEVEVIIAQGSGAQELMTVTNQNEEEEILEDRNVLMKLKKILSPGLKNRTSSSSSSESSSGDASLKSSSSSQASSSSESSERESGSSSSQSSSSSSSESSLVSRSFYKYATMKKI